MKGHDLARDLGISENLLKAFALVAGYQNFSSSDELTDAMANSLIAIWAAGEPRPIPVYTLSRDLKVTTVEVIRMCRRLGISVTVPNDQLTEFDARRVRERLIANGKMPSRQISSSTQFSSINFAAGNSGNQNGSSRVIDEHFAEPIPDVLDDFSFLFADSSDTNLAKPRWPNASQYDDALLNAKDDFLIDHLRTMHVVSGDDCESSIFSTGAFACVAKVLVDDVYWALRLLVRSQDEIVDRYRAIRVAQDRGELSDLLAPVEYFENAVRVLFDGVLATYPAILVRWLDGLTLSRFVVEAYDADDLDSLNRLVLAMRQLRIKMIDHEVAHGDLSPDNMMVEDAVSGLEVRLLDYDSLWFPEISELRCSVSAEGDFQHPLRPNPIGPMADQIAFAMYDLTLRFLVSGEKIDGLRNLFDQRILMGRDEWILGSSTLAKRLQSFDQSTYDQIALCLVSDYSSIEDLFHGKPSDVGLRGDSRELMPEIPPESLTTLREGLSFDQISAVLEISSGRLGQVLRQLGLDPNQMFSDLDLGTIEGAIGRQTSARTAGAKNSSSRVGVETPRGEVHISDVGRRIGLDVESAARLVQDVVNRAVGQSSSISFAELDDVRARVRDDQDFRYNINKVCRVAGVDPQRAIEVLLSDLPRSIRIRPYAIRITDEGREFLLGYRNNSSNRRARAQNNGQSNSSPSRPGGQSAPRGSREFLNVHKVAAIHGLSVSETRLIAKLAFGYDPGEAYLLSDVQAGILERRIGEIVRMFPIVVELLAQELSVSPTEVSRAIESLPDSWREVHCWANGQDGRLSLLGRHMIVIRLRDLGRGVLSEGATWNCLNHE